jgi:hypothetical protein
VPVKPKVIVWLFQLSSWKSRLFAVFARPRYLALCPYFPFEELSLITSFSATQIFFDTDGETFNMLHPNVDGEMTKVDEGRGDDHRSSIPYYYYCIMDEDGMRNLHYA